jgi:hypothetical protein
MNPIATIHQIYKLLQSVIPSKGPNDYGMLASNGQGGVACVRAVVLRGFDGEHHQIWINTNLRTHKVADLRHNPDAEVCLWLARKKIQLRLRAEWRVLDAALAGRTPALRELYQQAWENQPAYAQKMYRWPRPGEPVEGPMTQALPIESQEGDVIPPDFAVLLGTMYRIDALRLLRPYHERYVHERPRNVWLSNRVTA